LKKDYLNSLTETIGNGKFDLNTLKENLKNVNTFRKIRLASAMKYKLSNPESIVYRIRNGKTYSTEYTKTISKGSIIEDMNIAYKMILYSIIVDISKNVIGKKIYIPKGIEYVLPTSEKNFTGSVPNGTHVEVPNDMIVGIHWENMDYRRVDLDLSLLDETGKTGWNGRYRSEERDVLFSGDMTDAPLPNGASESFYIKDNTKTYLLMLNNFNAGDITIPFKIFIASQKVSTLPMNYMVDPNNVISTTKMEISKEQKMLGFIKDGKFYFTNFVMGGSSTTSRIRSYTEHTMSYCINSAMNSLSLNRSLEYAGAILVDKKEDCDIDLSLENIEKTSIINLISRK